MTELVWGAQGTRYYETGVDRGVLYPPAGPGVPWNGLISVTEKASGGQPRAYYADGYKYLNLASAEEFEATINAYSAPPEFGECDGTLAVLNGLFITQQPRKSFGFSYRTKVGNDTDGNDLGYKIHIVYNALANPSEKNNTSVSDSTSPITYSWAITTAPPRIVGYKPTAHFVVDTRLTPDIVLTQIENMLYGTPTSNPYLPAVTDIMGIFTEFYTIQLLEEMPGYFQLVQKPALMRNTQPLLSTGDSILWLDTSAGYSRLRLVIGD